MSFDPQYGAYAPTPERPVQNMPVYAVPPWADPQKREQKELRKAASRLSLATVASVPLSTLFAAVAGVFLGVEGDISGSIMFLIELEAAKNLIKKIMMGYSSGADTFDEMEMSALQEVSNIITGAYLNSLSMLTNLKIYPTPPSTSIDMAGAILSVPAIEFGALGDKILLIQSQFYDEVEIDGYFVLIPDMDSYKKILSSLGMM